MPGVKILVERWEKLNRIVRRGVRHSEGLAEHYEGEEVVFVALFTLERLSVWSRVILLQPIMERGPALREALLSLGRVPR